MAQAPASQSPQTVLLSHPPGAIQAGIAVAHDAVGSLGAQPVLLLIVVINVVFLAVAGFFLARLESTRSSLMLSTLDIVKTCVLGKDAAIPAAGAPGAP